jgi:UPF0755 protein
METKDNQKTKDTLVGKIILFMVFFVLFLGFILFFSPVREEKIIHISSNQTFADTVKVLESEDIVNFPGLFTLASKVLNINLKTGDYLFEKNSSFVEILLQLKMNNHKIKPVKITIREGLNNQSIADLLNQKLESFDKNVFLELSQNLEGQLFPDSYFFFPLTTEEEVIKELKNNFNNQTNPLQEKIKETGKSLNDILVMASILEGEAKGEKDNRIISGILWKRLFINMPLQVDIDKKTYEAKGLPQKPLNNPGLSSIKAAIDPVDSNYLYYLHDNEGNAYYAKDYEEHKKNINLYLK